MALLGERRLAVGLRSLTALLAAVAFLWPALSDATLLRLFAAYLILDGVIALAPGGWSVACRRVWPLLLGGCADLAAGVALYLWPGLDAAELATVVAFWALAAGVGFALASAALRDADLDGFLLLNGIAALVFGRALLSPPAANVVVLSTWMGLYALTAGILLLNLTLRQYRPMFLE